MSVNRTLLEAVVEAARRERPRDPVPMCGGCRRRPHAIPEYVEAAESMSEDLASVRDRFGLEQAMSAYVRRHEGTFNPETNRFLCDECFVKAGNPSTADGWQCP